MQTTKPGFGQLTGYLSTQRRKRQEFNEFKLANGTTLPMRTLATLDTFPAGRRCDSCDRRLAVTTRPKSEDNPIPVALCEPCARKAVFGQLQRNNATNRKHDKADGWFKDAEFGWEIPETESWQERYNAWQAQLFKEGQKRADVRKCFISAKQNII